LDVQSLTASLYTEVNVRQLHEGNCEQMGYLAYSKRLRGKSHFKLLDLPRATKIDVLVGWETKRREWVLTKTQSWKYANIHFLPPYP
jgi:hypothetical protein